MRTFQPKGRSPAHSRTPPAQQAVMDWLQQASPLETTLQKAQQMVQLQNLLISHLPAGMGDATRAAGIKAENEQAVLQILADNASVATRVRQTAPSLLALLQARGWKVTAIRIRVQPGLLSSVTQQNAASQHKNLPKHAIFGATAQASVGALANTLPDSPLRDALKRLLQHQAEKVSAGLK